ncbi:tripartite tricarboxylate transporter TctB family protein [Oscillibacter sp.]|uniref:tripartite tricarboxylate transporter TctB family protein n=1 Tax=Oscillibacter sp. TaxID=1945593 RepID=UPI001B652E47|nr:tripartite tricarboxylate transporter TctB family protein [Oscillibacter sp.]MBP3508894.1 tripartite tricarboxylate transporter TctB family protein [Oscillibacter sp.]
MEFKKTLRTQAAIPLTTAILALVFLVVGVADYGFWSNQPTPGFFPIIIAAVLLVTSLVCLFQTFTTKDVKEVRYNRNELLVILGGAGIILGTYLIGLVASCLVYIFLWLKFIERAPWKVVITTELIIAAIALGVFTGWLQVRFPIGLLGDLIL